MQLIKKMVLLFWLPPQYYHDIFVYVVVVLALFMAFRYLTMPTERILRGNSDSNKPTLLLGVAMMLFIGLRPVSVWFGDMVIYRRGFIGKCASTLPFQSSPDREIGWSYLEDLCRVLLPGQSANVQFELFSFIVAVVYVGGLAWGCMRFDRRHSFLLFTFVLTSFSFFTYAVNGMRNGMACSMVFLAMSWINTNLRGRIIAAIICVMAYSIHHSVALPACAMFLSYYFIKGSRRCIIFWLLSIVISLVAGSSVEAIMTSLGFDDRIQGYLASYMTVSELYGMDLKIGFRWDFLLYSALPIIIGWLTINVRGVLDRTYTLILNTYIISNAFWIMVILAAFSNRFAYLSWFMYGLVLAYPLVRFRVFDRPGLVIAVLLILQMVLTVLI